MVDGKPVARWAELIADLVGGAGQTSDLARSTLAPLILTGGSDKQVLKATDPATIRAFAAGYSRLSFDLCYCSILDECWRSKTDFTPGADDESEPQNVRSCPKVAVPFEP